MFLQPGLFHWLWHVMVPADSCMYRGDSTTFPFYPHSLPLSKTPILLGQSTIYTYIVIHIPVISASYFPRYTPLKPHFFRSSSLPSLFCSQHPPPRAPKPRCLAWCPRASSRAHWSCPSWEAWPNVK